MGTLATNILLPSLPQIAIRSFIGLQSSFINNNQRAHDYAWA